jgi:hypothetical protein
MAGIFVRLKLVWLETAHIGRSTIIDNAAARPVIVAIRAERRI